MRLWLKVAYFLQSCSQIVLAYVHDMKSRRLIRKIGPPVQSQFTAFEVGQVKAHVHHGLGPSAISRIVMKPDGKSHFSDSVGLC